MDSIMRLVVDADSPRAYGMLGTSCALQPMHRIVVRVGREEALRTPRRFRQGSLPITLVVLFCPQRENQGLIYRLIDFVAG